MLCCTVNELLDAGADPRIPNKDGDKPVDLLSYGAKANTALGKELFDRLRKGEAEAGIDASDIANDDDEGKWFRSGYLISPSSSLLTHATDHRGKRRDAIGRRIDSFPVHTKSHGITPT